MLQKGSYGFLGVARVDPLEAGDPDQIGKFRLLGRLGEGGMGRVFLGESPGGLKVAIKVVHPEYANDPQFRLRFKREVDTARRVGGFHAPVVVDQDPDANPPWMATAYIPGPSLADAIDQRGPLDDTGVRKLGAALAEGLATIHGWGIIHRDLKPSNVILADDGPRIIDFGISKSVDATSLTAFNAVIGTLRYMSPEQLHGANLTEQSDIFALGAILTYAATGHSPFDAPTISEVIAQICNGPPKLDPLTGDLRDIISECLATGPDDRPSAADLLARFIPRKARAESPKIGAAEAVAAAPLPPEPAHAADRPSLVSTIGVIRYPPAPPAPAEPPAAPARDARRKLRFSRRLAVVAAAIAVAAVALVGLGVLLLDKHPAAVPPVTESLVATLSGPASLSASSVAFGPNDTLATTDTNGSTYLWNTATKKLTATLADSASQQGAFSAAFGPDGILATGENDGSTDLWNTATTTGQHTATLTDTSAQVVPSVAFGPGQTLATDQVRSADLWNIATGKLTATLTDPATGGVFSLTFGPGGVLATGDGNGRTYLWNTTTKTIIATLTDPRSTGVESVAFGPRGTLLAIGDHNGNMYLWEIAYHRP